MNATAYVRDSEVYSSSSYIFSGPAVGYRPREWTRRSGIYIYPTPTRGICELGGRVRGLVWWQKARGTRRGKRVAPVGFRTARLNEVVTQRIQFQGSHRRTSIYTIYVYSIIDNEANTFSQYIKVYFIYHVQTQQASIGSRATRHCSRRNTRTQERAARDKKSHTRAGRERDNKTCKCIPLCNSFTRLCIYVTCYITAIASHCYYYYYYLSAIIWPSRSSTEWL